MRGETGAAARVIVVGCGDHAKVVAEIVSASSEVVGFVCRDHAAPGHARAHPVLGEIEELAALMRAHLAGGVIIGIGDNWKRGQVVGAVEALVPGICFVVAVHRLAHLASNVEVGPGTAIMAGVVVGPGTRIGRHCILNTNSSIDHDSLLADFASLAPAACTGGRVAVGSYSAVCLGANVINGVTIGEHAVIGAGATVVRDVAPRVVVYGTPAHRQEKPRDPGDPYLR